MNKKKLVFIGSYLSGHRGTKGIAEKIAILLKDQYGITLVSSCENKLIRMLDIIWTLLAKRFDKVLIDVYSNRGFIYADIASRIAKVKKEPIVMTLRGGMLAEKYEREPNRVRSVLQRANVVQSPSLFLIGFFKKQGIEVAYMPNFIDLSKFPYGRECVHPRTLLWVRAFSPEYRPELAVNTLKVLLKKYPETVLTMVGPDKGMIEEIKKLAEELGIFKHISFEGQVANEELYKYYQTHSVYLNTTVYESFGVAVLEAAACGIPVVSTKVGEIPYIWEENEEILLCDADAEQMAEKVEKIFESDGLATRLSVNARKKAESFEWKNVRPKWISLLQEETNEL